VLALEETFAELGAMLELPTLQHAPLAEPVAFGNALELGASAVRVARARGAAAVAHEQVVLIGTARAPLADDVLERVEPLLLGGVRGDADARLRRLGRPLDGQVGAVLHLGVVGARARARGATAATLRGRGVRVFRRSGSGVAIRLRIATVGVGTIGVGTIGVDTIGVDTIGVVASCLDLLATVATAATLSRDGLRSALVNLNRRSNFGHMGETGGGIWGKGGV
jgi:hypothetical protein